MARAVLQALPLLPVPEKSHKCLLPNHLLIRGLGHTWCELDFVFIIGQIGVGGTDRNHKQKLILLVRDPGQGVQHVRLVVHGHFLLLILILMIWIFCSRFWWWPFLFWLAIQLLKTFLVLFLVFVLFPLALAL